LKYCFPFTAHSLFLFKEILQGLYPLLTPSLSAHITTHPQKIKPKPAFLTQQQLLMAFNARQLRLNEEQIRLDLPHIKLDPPPVELCLRQTKRDARQTAFERQRITLCLRQIDFILLWIRPYQEQIKHNAHRTKLVFLRILRLFRLLWRDWPQIAATVMLAKAEQASAFAPPRSINIQIDGRAGLIAALNQYPNRWPGWPDCRAPSF
jgi:hypothetical protein